MAAKISTIILEVDLDCQRCYKKISKTLCKLQERVNIQTIAFDEKKNTVTISGPFDPQKVAKKLCCKAGNVIKDLQIKENIEKPKDPEPKKDKPKEPKPAEPAEPKKDKPKETKPDEPKKDKPKEDKPAEPKKDKPKEDKPAEPKEDKPKETKPEEPKEKVKPKDPEPKKDKPAPGPAIPDPVPQPVWFSPVCGCGCRPWYEGYYGDNRCCWCGRGYGCMPQVTPAVAYCPPAYGGYKTCSSTTFFCEEDQSSCNIM